MKVERAHIDIESHSEADIRAVGAYKYSEDLSTFLWCLSFRFGKGPKHIWLIPIGGEWPAELIDKLQSAIDGRVHTGREVPLLLREWIEAGKPLAAFNAAFERTMLNGAPGQMLNFPHTPISQWTCVAVKTRAHGLPGSLGDVCKALGTTEKSESGRAIMLQVCRPKKASKADPSTMYTPASAPDKFYDLAIYNLDDVESECGVDEVVPDIPASEVEIYQIDQAINDRGVLVDLPFIDDVMFLIAERKKELEVACRKMTTSETEPEGIAPTQRAKIADWIRLNGWPTLLDMQAETVKALLENTRVPDKVKKMLRIYSTYGLKATAKFEVMRDAACADGRIRGQFIMNGAGPGRWSAVLVQLQNLLRPVIKDPAIAKQAIKTRSLEWIRCLYPDVEPMKVFASCTRNALIAAPGKKFIALDFAGIESRVGAWLADEHWKLDAFRKADAKLGPDTYTLAYSRMFQVPVEEITKGDSRRQIGKVCLAGDTLVLCERGWTRIDCVLPEDKVWDGDKWTTHGGLIYNGLKRTARLCGISLTPDHQVWSGTNWFPAQSLVASNALTRRALASAAVNLPSQATSSDLQMDFAGLLSNATVTRENTWWRLITSNANYLPDATRAPKLLVERSGTGSMRLRLPTTNIVADSLTGSRQQSADATTAGAASTKITAVAESKSASCGGLTKPPSCDTSRLSPDGTTPSSRWTEKTTTDITKKATFGSSPRKPTSTTDEPSESSAQKTHVYDLLSVGSKNRFVVLSSEGPLLVHNCELALGYEGGVGAFVTMTKTYGVKLDELAKAVLPLLSEDILESSEWLYAKSDRSVPRDQFLACDGIKRLWRQNHPRIAQLWVDIRDAMYEAVQDPGTVYSIPNKKLMFKVEGRWLYMRLPSGRRIAYVDPEIYRPKVKCDACKGDGVINAFVCEKCSGGGLIEGRPVVTYMGVDTKTRRWMRVSTYGGKGLENGDQGYSSCLLRHGMRQFEKELLTIVMHVHDELLAEVDENWDCMGLAEECMAGRMPAHAAGLPIAVEGWEGKEFRK